MEPRELDDEEALSQYGRLQRLAAGDDKVPVFREAPRADEAGVSLQLGHLTAEEVAPCVVTRPYRKGDLVRHTTVGTLRTAGFHVRHDPIEHQILACSEGHVAVERDAWTEGSPACEAFDACFSTQEATP